MAKDWIMVRISRDTHRHLQEVRFSMEDADLRGQRQLVRDDRDRVSLDQVISLLIAFRKRHAERRDKAARNRKRRSEAVQANVSNSAPIAADPE